MRHSSRSSSASNAHSTQHTAHSTVWVSLFAVCCLLFTALGCESLQRKLTRKPKHPKALPTPVISFIDYSRAMTPVERYRKHYMMFDYWNAELLGALQQTTPNGKRIKLASAEALAELETMRRLVSDSLGERLVPLLKERANLDRELQRGPVSRAEVVVRALETQTRRIHREFFWRDVEEQITPQDAAPAAEGGAGADAGTP